MPIKKAIQISEAEAVIMQILWEKNPLSADEVISALSSQQAWQEATVKTLLNRLLKKGAINATLEGRRYFYSPVLKREQWINAESKGFLDRMFNGKVAPLVAHFSERNKLTKSDIAELKLLIKRLDDAE